jgi:hypothetical protein
MVTSEKVASKSVHYIIVGTNHILQKSDSQDPGLRDLLRSILIAHPDVALIAEEVDTRVKVRTFGLELIGEDKWLSVDMTTPEKKEAGIYHILNSSEPVYDPVTDSDVAANAYHTKSDGKKETFWLNKIERWCEDHQVSDGTIVITCGHNHLKFLTEKVEIRGHSVTKQEYLPYDKEVHGKWTVYED